MRVVCSCGTLRWRLKNLCQMTRTGFLTVVWGTGTPKERDEVNRRDVCECDGWVCVPEVIGAPSMLRLTLKVEVLTRVMSTSTFVCKENAARRKLKSPLFCYGNWTPETVVVFQHHYADDITYNIFCCLLFIDKVRAKDKTYIWVSVWWKTKT